MGVNFLEVFYLKKGNIEDIEINPIVINRLLGLYDKSLLKYTVIFEKNIYSIRPFFYNNIFNLLIKKTNYLPKTRDIKSLLEQAKENKVKTDRYNIIYKKIVEHYNWGKNEEDIYRKYYTNIFEKDKEILKYYMRYFDLDRKTQERLLNN